MGIEFAIKTLCRSINAEDFAQKRNSWSFWATPSNTPVINDDVSKLGSCWSQLKFTGMMQWGQRRQVRYLGRHEEKKFESLHHKEKCVFFEGSNMKKRKNVEEEMVAIKVAPFRQNKEKILIDRWCAKRYKLAEENVLKVMKEKKAVYGNPIMRSDLRSEARKYIGDTGLMDHLLKHMAGKVAPGGVERFRRRHNAEGSMEYWLESADLVDIRKEFGVQDPYWTPPPGWKHGDSISQSPDHVTSNELRKIKEEIVKLKRDMQELASKKEEEALAIVATPTSCLSSLNFEDYGSQVSKQVEGSIDISVELVHRKAKIEEQLKKISLAMSGMEDQLGMLKPTVVDEPIMSESSTPLLVAPASLSENIGEEIREYEKGSSAAEQRLAKIERLKSGFQICKPKGTFMWPNMSPHVLTNLDEHTMIPTPTSVPKLVTKSQTQNLTLSLLNPSSPFKPLAERRTVSTATLTHVAGPFSPHLSPPLETPNSTITKNSSSINLNETPLGLE